MARKPRPRFVAYRFMDPMTSPKIKQDEVLFELLMYLCNREAHWVGGPAIYYVPVKADGKLADPATESEPIGMWVGGLKIRLFEGIEEPTAQGVTFIRGTEFVTALERRFNERNQDGETRDIGETVRDDGPGTGFVRDQTDSVRGSGGVEELDDPDEAESETELDSRGIREGDRGRGDLQHPGDS